VPVRDSSCRLPDRLTLGSLLPRALKLERFGIAGFGWGTAWVTQEERVEVYRSERSLADDRVRARRLEAVESYRFLLHLRRPSRLSTIGMADTQPFLVPSGGFAFCHNGFFERGEELRPSFAGRLHGLADSEIGFRLLEDLLARRIPPARAMEETLCSTCVCPREDSNLRHQV
jgi:predicted glutamine amidotransferase